MSSLTRVIEEYIRSLLENDDIVVLRRKELASKFGCVPSQINYVIKSKFTPERGYIVESKRGEHGFIRIIKLKFCNSQDVWNYVEDLLDDVITEEEASKILANLQSQNFLTDRERILMEIVLRYIDEVTKTLFDLPRYKRNGLRAELLKRMLKGVCLS